MERYERAVAGQREGEEEQGGEVPVPGAVAGAVGGMAREAASSEQEAISETGNAGGHGAAESESDDEEDALTEESVVVAPAGNAGRGVDSRSAQNEDHEMPEENPAPTHFELRGFRAARRAIIRAMPPSSYRHMPLRSRKRPNPTRLNDMGGAGSGGANAHDPGTYSEAAGGPSPSAGFGSAPATPRSVFPSAMVNARHGARNEALGSTARLSRWTPRSQSRVPAIPRAAPTRRTRRPRPRHATYLLAAGSSAAPSTSPPTPRKPWPWPQPAPRLTGATLLWTGSSRHRLAGQKRLTGAQGFSPSLPFSALLWRSARPRACSSTSPASKQTLGRPTRARRSERSEWFNFSQLFLQ
ncbi:hypothetical protein GQ55_5G465200 [Panicum hallii var. hallii]|uniref:Uncharacterized protein n=1 Tax=Panicum hallii var. hallii TaxID=1504633 RepID=A0A2T7DQP3_9POAL|nr:hypothetical protein GQ55_5G465200 [Panicum hallii var. hallii]